VYAAGYDGTTDLAVYWVDGTKHALSGPTGVIYSMADDIVVQNGSVYVAGNCCFGAGCRICYWKDGVRTDLPDPPEWINQQQWISGIAVSSDGTVYSAGVEAMYYAYIWNGTTPSPLTVGATRSADIAAGISVGTGKVFLSGDTLYVAGDWTHFPPGYHAAYWSGATEYDLPGSDASKGSSAISIFVDGSNVYTAGTVNLDGTNDNACYWVGLSRTDLPAPAISWSNAVIEKWGTVYSAGGYGNASSTVFGGCYWVGTTRTDIEVPAGATGANAYDIALTW
jgi:hypothetical protein